MSHSKWHDYGTNVQLQAVQGIKRAYMYYNHENNNHLELAAVSFCNRLLFTGNSSVYRLCKRQATCCPDDSQRLHCKNQYHTN